MAKLLSHPVAVFIICALSNIARLLAWIFLGVAGELIFLKSIHEGGHKWTNKWELREWVSTTQLPTKPMDVGHPWAKKEIEDNKKEKNLPRHNKKEKRKKLILIPPLHFTDTQTRKLTFISSKFTVVLLMLNKKMREMFTKKIWRDFKNPYEADETISCSR